MTDALCYDDLDLFGTELDDPVAELEQDLYHRLIEPRGMNADDPDRGLGIEDALSGPFDDSIGPRIEAEFAKDGRVDVAKATVSATGAAAFRVDIQIEPEGTIAVLLDDRGLRRVT